MNESIGKLLSVGLVSSIMLEHDVVAQCAICVVLTLALRIRTAKSLVQFNISLSLRHFANLEPVFVPLVCEPLNFAIIEVFYA